MVVVPSKVSAPPIALTPFYLSPAKKIINLSDPPHTPPAPFYEQPPQNFGELEFPL